MYQSVVYLSSSPGNDEEELQCLAYPEVQLDNDDRIYVVLDDYGDYDIVEFIIEDEDVVSGDGTDVKDVQVMHVSDSHGNKDEQSSKGDSSTERTDQFAEFDLMNIVSSVAKFTIEGDDQGPDDVVESVRNSRVTITSGGRLGNNICQYAHLYLIGMRDGVEVWNRYVD